MSSEDVEWLVIGIAIGLMVQIGLDMFWFSRKKKPRNGGKDDLE